MPVEVEVAVGSGARIVSADRAVEEAELAAWSGRKPLVFFARHGLIESVDPASWAEPLGPEGWSGRSLGDLVEILAEQFGTSSEPIIEDHGDGVVVAETSFHRDGFAPVTVRTLASVGADPGTVRVALAVDGPIEPLVRDLR